MQLRDRRDRLRLAVEGRLVGPASPRLSATSEMDCATFQDDPALAVTVCPASRATQWSELVVCSSRIVALRMSRSKRACEVSAPSMSWLFASTWALA